MLDPNLVAVYVEETVVTNEVNSLEALPVIAPHPAILHGLIDEVVVPPSSLARGVAFER